MAKNLLDAAQVSAALEQVGGRAVAQAVRARVAGRPPLAQALVDDPASGPRIQATAARAEKQGRPRGRRWPARACRSEQRVTARRAGTPTGTVRSLSPLPRTRTVLRAWSKLFSVSPHSSLTRMPVA